MPFVKLDCGLLNSTLWIDRVAREVFITALLLAEPIELKEPTVQINVRDLNETDFYVPAGWYGFVPAAGIGIIHRASVENEEGLKALELLGSEDNESRSPEFGGRRMVRIDGGYLILNFIKYRERDYTSAERSRRYRERKKNHAVTHVSHTVISQPVTQAEAEAEAEVEVKENKKRGLIMPTSQEVSEYAKSIGFDLDGQHFIDYYETRGWKLKGGIQMKCWKASVRTWSRGDNKNKPKINNQVDFNKIADEKRKRELDELTASGGSI